MVGDREHDLHRKRSVGGAADTRELPGLTITKVAVGPMDNNAYLLRCTADRRARAHRRGERRRHAARADRRHAAGHDHHHPPALGPPRRAGARCSRPPAPPRSRIPRTRRACRSRSPGRCSTATRSPSATPGCRSSTCAATRRAASPSSTTATASSPISRTCSPATRCSPAARATPSTTRQRFGSLITDLEERVFAELPDGTWVYPGHGGDTTLGAERPHVPEWRARGW